LVPLQSWVPAYEVEMAVVPVLPAMVPGKWQVVSTYLGMVSGFWTNPDLKDDKF